MNRALKDNEVEMGNLTENMNSIDYEMRSHQETAARLQRRLSSITDSRVAFLRKIPQKFSAAAVASDWVRDNQRRFRSEVYGPVGMHIRVSILPHVAFLIFLTVFVYMLIYVMNDLHHACVCHTLAGG
jgi:hypothetical protein